MVHRRWILALLFALMTVPLASARPVLWSVHGPQSSDATDLPDRLTMPELPDVGPTDVALGMPDLMAVCTPALVFERTWFGAVATDSRHQEQQALAPVGVVGELTRFVPSLGNGLLLPGSILMVPVTETVKSVVDVAVNAAWDEVYLSWAEYTDHLYVGAGDADLPSLLQPGPGDVDGWTFAGASMQCGLGGPGLGYQRDPASAGVQYKCLGCNGIMPADGWALANIAAIDVWIAKAKDYTEMPPLSQTVCPDEVAEAILDRVNELKPTIEDAVRQQAARAEAGLPRIL